MSPPPLSCRKSSANGLDLIRRNVGKNQSGKKRGKEEEGVKDNFLRRCNRQARGNKALLWGPSCLERVNLCQGIREVGC